MSMPIRQAQCRVVPMAALVVAGLLFPVWAMAQYEQVVAGALAEFRAGNYSSAAAKFGAVEAATPGATDALLFQAKCFVHLEDFVGADTALHKYLGSHRKSADAMYLLGFVQHRENRPAESLQTYTQAAMLLRPTGDDLKIVGLDYVLLNDYTDAIRWLEKAVELDAQNKDAWYYLGRSYYTRSRLIDARKAFLTVLALDPRNAKAENGLGLIFESDAQPSAAIEAYRKAISWGENSPHPSEQPYVNLGSLLLEQGRIEEAISELGKSVTLAPNNGYCRLKLGTAYMRAGKLAEAQKELETATSLEPENAVAHYQLGRLYKQIQAVERARAEFDRASELQSRAAGAMLNSSNH
jgi:tetratricopeptide (TPR) repeat protein